MDPLVKQVVCGCGDRTFAVRIDADEQVGLLTCARDHHSLLTTETLRKGQVEPLDAALVVLGKKVLTWLPERFTFTGRGNRTFDNAREAARLKLGR